jgi:F-type H+-transporting ATPase subunit delta
MGGVNDTAIAIADEYVEATLPLAEARGEADLFLAELGVFIADMQADETLAHFMTSPLVDPDRRQDVLERLLRGKLSDLVLNTVLILNRRYRSELLPLVHERFRLALEQRRKEVDVFVTTAYPLTADLRSRLSAVLVKHTGRTPMLRETVDPDVMAGLKVQINDELLDDSAANHLRRMQRAFLERATYELHAGKLPFADR